MTRSTRVVIRATEAAMGDRAGTTLTELLEEYTVGRGAPVVLNLAAAPSQDASYKRAVALRDRVDWARVTAIHLDEYLDLDHGHPNTFAEYLREHVLDAVPIEGQNVIFIKDVQSRLGGDATAADVAREYGRVATAAIRRARSEGGVVIGHLGVGVNGHIAFNEPHVDKWATEFALPVSIDDVSVRQQYDDYNNHPNPAARYASVDEVPRETVTMSVAGLLEAEHLLCVVPGAHKADAVQASLDGPIDNRVAGSMLRLAKDCRWFLTTESAAKLARAPRVEP